ncbi:MAG: HAD-IC family P-type ATPase, partial [Elusimicrobia bacterium]|nr:HAD-IC family P-type ATPase [Elusimicrobiota bacterium]
AAALERLRAADTLVVVKTGTLSEGRPRLDAVRAAPGQDEAELLRLAASLERASEHPLAAAVAGEARRRSLALSEPSDFRSVAGRGLLGTVDGRRIAVGNEALLKEAGIDAALLRALAPEAATALFVAIDGAPAGVLTAADPIKPSAAGSIARLKEAGVRIVMLTGDSAEAARAVGGRLGIAEVHGGLLPADKERIIAELQREGRVVAMAGDGVNDAPALARADVGLAMGTGADVALESAGITIMNGDLRGVLRAFALSRATLRNIKQNLFFAFVYNALGVPAAALGLLNPMFAALAMTLSSVSVIGNALRLRRQAL